MENIQLPHGTNFECGAPDCQCPFLALRTVGKEKVLNNAAEEAVSSAESGFSLA